MEQVKTVAPVSSQSDVDIKRIIEERREARKQKLLARLGRKLVNPVSVSSLEALTGTLRSKNQPITPAVIMPTTTATNKCVTKPREAQITKSISKPEVKKEVTSAAKKPQVKRAISFQHTSTSQRRITMAQHGLLPSELSTKSLPKPEQNQIAAPIPQVAKLQKQKLTVPRSPNFINRVRQPLVSKSATKPASKVVPNLKAKPSMSAFKKAVPKSALATKTEVDGPAENVTEKSAFMFPLTPEDKTRSGLAKSNCSPRTPNVKPFARKSFSESKDNGKAGARFARSVSFASLSRSNSTLSSRKSVAPSTFSRASRSIWPLQKEPSEKEKIQQWLEKRGRSTSSCRHLGCLGHQLKEFQVSSTPNTKIARKSIKVVKQEVVEEIHASPKLTKRQSSVLNTTFEKEDENEDIVAPPPPFRNEPESHAEDEVVPINQEQPSATQGQTVAQDEVDEEHFLTPRDEKRNSAFDLTDLQEGRVDKLLETISALFNEPIYPGAKIQSWLMQSEAAFPVVKTHALYWDIRARLEERRGNYMEALDIYKEAIEKQAEPVDTIKQMFDTFLLRIGSNFPSGERTPLLKSLGVGTPMIQRRLTTPRRPLLDSTQVFQSTTVKYELKLKQIFDEHMKENADFYSAKKPTKTPVKFRKDSNRLSVACEGAYQLVATPVRRSMRPRATPSMSKVEEVEYVDDLEQLSPTTKAKAVLRKNAALAFD